MSVILNHVTHYYDQGMENPVKALDDVSLTVTEGEFLAIIGHTGSGKSTLVQHLNGLLMPSSGQVLWNGEDIAGKDFDRTALRGNVGLVFQYPEHQLFETSVFKDVCFGPLNMGFSKIEAEKRAYEAMQLVGLGEDKWNASPFELSGGEKRRAAIAGVLAMNPTIMILDEPTAGLDPGRKNELMDQVEKLKAEKGMGIVLVSHSMDDVAEHADRVVVMDKGRIIMNDEPRAVFSRYSELEEIGLGAPQITYIVKELYDRGLSQKEFVLNMEEAVAALDMRKGAAG